jgi:hypothetical protein
MRGFSGTGNRIARDPSTDRRGSQGNLASCSGTLSATVGISWSAIEALKQLRDTPQHHDMEKVKQTVSERDRLVIFRNRATELKEHFWYVEGTVAVSVDGVLLRSTGPV